MVAFLLMLLVLATVARLVLTSVGERGNPELEARHTAEIARLREEVDQLQSQVMRLTDEQSFLTRLLAEREAPAGELPPPSEAPPGDPNPETS
jgi:uncharacterized protein YlxW (UPF0749 family)